MYKKWRCIIETLCLAVPAISLSQQDNLASDDRDERTQVTPPPANDQVSNTSKAVGTKVLGRQQPPNLGFEYKEKGVETGGLPISEGETSMQAKEPMAKLPPKLHFKELVNNRKRHQEEVLKDFEDLHIVHKKRRRT